MHRLSRINIICIPAVFFLIEILLVPMERSVKRRLASSAALFFLHFSLHVSHLLHFQVGVDPLLRTAIWDHLTSMTSKKTDSSSRGCTIVITTHYIEEARQAGRVGMMRFGKLLAEDTPENLLQR